MTTNQFYFTAAACSLVGLVIPLAMVSFKRQRQPSSLAQDKTHKNYWYDRVHPELIALPMYTINSWWMAWIAHALSSMPGKTDAEIIMTKVKGIGTYYYPATKSKQNYNEKQQPTRAILWIHGGGRILGAANGMSEPCQKIVKMFGGIPVLSVEYQFPPKHPFPAALQDCKKAYSWLVNKVQLEGRIAVAGMSAGAGLAAELCQLILDEGNLPLPVCQLLLDPMLDDRTCVNNETISNLPPHLVWNNQSNMYAWSLYLGPDHKPGDEILPRYASASRRADLSGLPPALITVGDLDLFHDECTEYAQRLKNDGVKTDFVVTKGGFHAFMSMQPDKGPSVDVWRKFHAFGKSFLFV